MASTEFFFSIDTLWVVMDDGSRVAQSVERVLPSPNPFLKYMLGKIFFYPGNKALGKVNLVSPLVIIKV